MTERESLIDALLAARDKLLATYNVGAGKPVFYYPVSLVEQAKLFWGESVRVEPVRALKEPSE